MELFLLRDGTLEPPSVDGALVDVVFDFFFSALSFPWCADDDDPSAPTKRNRTKSNRLSVTRRRGATGRSTATPMGTSRGPSTSPSPAGCDRARIPATARWPSTGWATWSVLMFGVLVVVLVCRLACRQGDQSHNGGGGLAPIYILFSIVGFCRLPHSPLSSTTTS